MRTATVTATATAVVLALAAGAAPSAVAHERPTTGDERRTTGEKRPTADGYWRVDGYGTVLALRNGILQEYQTTSVSCLKGDSARRTGNGRYTAADGSVRTVRTGPGKDRATLSFDSSVGHRALRRVQALPDDCTRPAPKGPRAAFDVFWQSFAENYPFFAAKGVDWDAVRERYRPQVHTDTTRKELFSIFSKMVKPLHDAHVAVIDGKRVYAEVRPGTVMPSKKLDTKVKKFIEKRDLKHATYRKDFAGGRITYADLPGGQGYLRISGFAGYAPQGAPFAAHLAELDRALDTVLTKDRTQRLKGLMIDLRVNGGGSDLLGIRIAERLTDTPYVAYSKRARNDPADPGKHTRPEPIRVRPADAPRYTGPIALLTGGSTVSAGETFTQALMDRPGRTVRVGRPTQGVFSDVLARDLPGGMAVWLPNEEFLTRTGRTFDGTGVPPHLSEPVFTKEEFAKNRDSAFDRALRVLTAR
ncbi:S41 family peptidase [Streptomyces spectabilis]|uniref:Protease n=1 Tax=Streptomyces spectabilis TaxID=68270 RepID=A0A5P2XGN1_STRST|nr:S41 family peptidase [Streptomyces spectabilis]MCI3907487.1 S41 family peptidase [Streptomyces spectabilis]QEV64187.1 protease [Streptomyces spectabilis]GGV31796.1 peptidase [Streptomyces spectabilis]